MATVRFEFLKPKKDGTTPVVITVTHQGVRKRLSTNIFLEKNEISKNGKILSFEKKKRIEDFLNDCRVVLEDIAREKLGQKYDVEYIFSRLSAAEENRDLDFFKFADDWIAKSDIKGKKNYRSMLTSLESFLHCRYLPFNNITYTLLSDYAYFLRDKERAQSLYIGSIRHIFREAIRTYNNDQAIAIKNDPFTRFLVPRQKKNLGGKRALSLDEFLRIYNYKHDIPSSLPQLARDCFVLSFCLMGMNSVDMFTAARPSRGVIRYQRAKTKDRREDGAYIEVNIPPQVKDLCKKYADHNRLFNFHNRYCDAAQFNKYVNRGLKKVGEAVGIPDLQFYQARHTFATLSRNLMHFSKEDVDEALNHIGDHGIADVYIKKDFSIINENNRLLLEKVFEK